MLLSADLRFLDQSFFTVKEKATGAFVSVMTVGLWVTLTAAYKASGMRAWAYDRERLGSMGVIRPYGVLQVMWQWARNTLHSPNCCTLTQCIIDVTTCDKSYLAGKCQEGAAVNKRSDWGKPPHTNKNISVSRKSVNGSELANDY